MTARRVAVIGGGLAGLAGAARLRQLGASPVVFERDREVGGVVRTHHRDGWAIDTGPSLAAEPAVAVRELLDAAGLDRCTVRTSAAGATRYIVLNGVPVVLPRTTAEFSSSSVLSIGGRLRLLKERFVPARRDVADESVASFARRRFGDEMADRMFDPLIASTCAGDPTQILARYAFPTLVGHEQGPGSSLQGSARARMEARRRSKGRPSGSWSCADGMQQLPRELAKWIGNVCTGAPIDRIAVRGKGVDVTPRGGPAEAFDAVLVAVPARTLGQIAIDAPRTEGLGHVASMPHASIAVVSLGFRRDQVAHPLDGSRLLVPSVERRSILSAVFPSSLFLGRAPDNHVLITAFVGGVQHRELVDLDDDALVALVAKELLDLLGANGVPAMRDVAIWRDALPQAVAGHAERLASADAVEAASPQIAFAGSWRDGLAVGDVLLGGVRAAERLAERFGWLAA